MRSGRRLRRSAPRRASCALASRGRYRVVGPRPREDRRPHLVERVRHKEPRRGRKEREGMSRAIATRCPACVRPPSRPLKNRVASAGCPSRMPDRGHSPVHERGCAGRRRVVRAVRGGLTMTQTLPVASTVVGARDRIVGRTRLPVRIRQGGAARKHQNGCSKGSAAHAHDTAYRNEAR